MPDPLSFCYFKTSPEIIQLAVMLYVRFPLSLRNLENLLHERGIGPSVITTSALSTRIAAIDLMSARSPVPEMLHAERKTAFPRNRPLSILAAFTDTQCKERPNAGLRRWIKQVSQGNAFRSDSKANLRAELCRGDDGIADCRNQEKPIDLPNTTQSSPLALL